MIAQFDGNGGFQVISLVPPVAPARPYKEALKSLIGIVNQYEQLDIPVRHTFHPGEYWREITMPAGMTGVGHIHKQRHLNIVLSGKAIVSCDGIAQAVEAPAIFVCEPGAQKAFQVIEDFRLVTVHQNPDNLTDIVEVEKLIFDLPDDIIAAGIPLNDFRMQRNQLTNE